MKEEEEEVSDCSVPQKATSNSLIQFFTNAGSKMGVGITIKL